MRNRNSINQLSRTRSHRKAMLANMAASLIQHKRINTTVAKAKELKTFVEPLITKSKNDTTHSRRVVFSYLKDKYAVTELFREVAPKIADRPGGYTRIIRTGFRQGDAAEMCMIELVDFNELYTSKKETAKGKKRSRRGGGAKKATTAAAPAEATAKKEEGKAEEAEVVEEKAETAPKAEAKAEEPKKEEAPEDKKSDDKKEG